MLRFEFSKCLGVGKNILARQIQLGNIFPFKSDRLISNDFPKNSFLCLICSV